MKSSSRNDRIFSQTHPSRIVIIYFCLSALWIILSDLVVNNYQLFNGTTLIEISKGLGFVLATSLLLYFLIGQAVSNLKKVNSELNNSLAHYDSITRHTTDVIWTIDLITRTISFISPSITQLLGFTPEDVIGRKIDALFKSNSYRTLMDEVSRQMEKYRNNISGLNYFTFELKQECADGSYKDTEVVVNFIKNDEGEVCEILGITRDISIKKQYENELIKSKQQYQDLFDQNPLPMWIFDIDSLKFLHVNKAACVHYGYTYDEFMGMTILDIRPYVDRAEIVAISKTLHNTPQKTSTWNHVKKNGEIITVEITTYNFQYYEKNARLVLINDITEKVKALRELEESQHLLSSVTDTVPVAIYILDIKNNNIVFANKAIEKLSGYKPDEIINEKSGIFEKMIYPEDIPIIKDGYATLIAMNGNEVREREYRMHNKSGNTFWCHNWEIVFKRNESGLPELVLGAVEDITAIKNAENIIKQANETLEQRVQERTYELEETNTELEAFTYTVSHDLRAPLRAISGFAKILNDDYAKLLDAEGLDLLNEVIHNSVKMSRLIDDLLAFSRIGKKDVVRTNIRIGELITNTFNEIAKRYSGKTINLNMRHLPDTYADYSMLKQVVENLISNAIKFSTVKDVITITVKSETKGDYNIYSIEDNGVGFNPKFIDKLFKVFQRLHSAEEFEGTGVGLAIVHRIITKHSGSVWAESRPGEGSTFYFSLPNL
jgi:PAS domain S-box-containing protein